MSSRSGKGLPQGRPWRGGWLPPKPLLLLLLPLLIVVAKAEERQQAVAQVSSSLASSAMVEGGSCGGGGGGGASGQGCRREVVSATAAVLHGQPLEGDACGVLEFSAGDGYTVDDLRGATLGVLHSCENSDGLVLAQVREET